MFAVDIKARHNMSQNGWELNEEIETDVLVLGGGLAGLAAAINLARGGMRVICLEPRQSFKNIVGESLDWSAPDLLAALHLPMDELVATGGATFKKSIVLHDLDGRQQSYKPNPWLARFPLNVEVRTLHLDRRYAQMELEQTARAYGVTTVRERAKTVQGSGRRITSIKTSGGRTIAARWVVDASGAAASLLGRHFNLKSVSYGPRKVSIWGHNKDNNESEGTSLYALRGKKDYMEWLWEIPIRPGVTSLGYVAPGIEIKRQRALGLSTAEIFRAQLAK